MESTDYISFSISGSSRSDGQWCAERADWYVSNYMTYAPSTSTTTTSGSWQKWYRTERGSWSAATTSAYANYYGPGCDSNQYSWCSEWDLGGLRLVASPANPDAGESYASGWSYGEGWDVEIAFAATRLEACGF